MLLATAKLAFEIEDRLRWEGASADLTRRPFLRGLVAVCRIVQGVAMRRVAVRLLAGLFAVGWLVFPGFGAIDLSVTWDADWPQVLEAGWGLFFTVIVSAAFALVALRPRGPMPAAAQLAVATVALAISAVVAREDKLFAFVALLALQTAILGWLLRGGSAAVTTSTGPQSSGISRALLAVGAVGLVPWLSYALHMWALNRDERSDSDITLGIDHYSVQGALALSLAVLPLLAAWRQDARPFIPVCAGTAAFYLGLVSLASQSSPGGRGQAGSAAAMVWAIALLAIAFSRYRAEREGSLPQNLPPIEDEWITG